MKKGNKVVHRGITNDLERRQAEHQAQFPGAKIEHLRDALSQGPRAESDPEEAR